MNARSFPVLLLAVGAIALSSCAGQQHTTSNKHLKLETIQRPFGPTTYLYRETSDPSPRQ